MRAKLILLSAGVALALLATSLTASPGIQDQPPSGDKSSAERDAQPTTAPTKPLSGDKSSAERDAQQRGILERLEAQKKTTEDWLRDQLEKLEVQKKNVLDQLETQRKNALEQLETQKKNLLDQLERQKENAVETAGNQLRALEQEASKPGPGFDKAKPDTRGEPAKPKRSKIVTFPADGKLEQILERLERLEKRLD